MGPTRTRGRGARQDEITLLTLAKSVIEQTASHSQIVFEPLPTDDPLRRRPDISRAFSTLRWQPRVGLREGIERVIPYFKSQLEALNASPAQATEMRIEGVGQAL